MLMQNNLLWPQSTSVVLNLMLLIMNLQEISVQYNYSLVITFQSSVSRMAIDFHCKVKMAHTHWVLSGSCRHGPRTWVLSFCCMASMLWSCWWFCTFFIGGSTHCCYIFLNCHCVLATGFGQFILSINEGLSFSSLFCSPTVMNSLQVRLNCCQKFILNGHGVACYTKMYVLIDISNVLWGC